MPQVQTVLGPISPDDVGNALMHEHLIFELSGWELNPLLSWDRNGTIQNLIGRLKEARDVGLGTFVDLTAIGVTRDISLMQDISRGSGVHVVACTGWWLKQGIQAHFATLEIGDLARIMVHELTKGIGDGGPRAGIIKVATAENMIEPEEERVLRAAGRAQAETGVCVSSHTSRSTMGEEQIAIMTEEGANPEKLVIGHSDNREDLDYHRRMLAKGVTVEYDHLSSPFSLDDRIKSRMLATLIGEGYASQLTLSHDTVGDLPGRPNSGMALLDKRPTYLFTKFLPMLREEGVSEDAINQMVRANPARLLPF